MVLVFLTLNETFRNSLCFVYLCFCHPPKQQADIQVSIRQVTGTSNISSTTHTASMHSCSDVLQSVSRERPMVCFCSNEHEVWYPSRSDEGQNIKPEVSHISSSFTNLQPKASQYEMAEH